MSILSKLKINGSAFASLINEPEILENNSTTTMLRVGREVPYKASIQGTALNAYVTLREARLTRLSLLQQTSRGANSHDYWLVTGVMQPVKMDIDLIVDGERVNLVDLFHQIACESAGTSITREEFLLNARKIGMNFIDGQPLFFQQFGANYDSFAKAIDHFKNAGAKDVIHTITRNTGRIKAAYELKPGMPLSAFEVGSVDRTQSARYTYDNIGQGFQNLVDAQFEQLTRIIGLRKSANVKRKEAEAPGISEEMVISLKNSADLDAKMSKMAISNWAGAQRRLQQQPDGSFEMQPIYDAVNLPCGRFTMLNGNGEFEVDLWTNNRNKTTVATANEIAESATEPF